MKRTFIGVDMGTSGIKLVLIDENRNILSQTSLEYELSHPKEGWAEINPVTWYESMLKALHVLLQGQNAKLVESIGVTGQMHTLILLDSEGTCIRPAIMWNDKRTAKIIPFLRRELLSYPEGKYFSDIISTGSPAANLYWVSREEPEIFAKCNKFLIGPDYLVYRLTGNYSTDFVEASTSCLYRVKNRKWSSEIRNFIGLNESSYPEIRGSCEFAGYILPEIAEELGLSDSVRVITGTGDNPAAAVSTGCISKGYPVLSLGTSGVLMFPVKNIDDAAKGKKILYSSDGKNFLYLVQGTVQSTGTSINWFLRKILNINEYGSLDSKIDDEIIRRSNILFYPHINGDKTIYADPELKGAFTGLESNTTASEMYYAVLEGLCFAFKQLSEYMHMPSNDVLKVIGGGSKSDLWLQTLANVLDIRVERLGGSASPSYGAALLASSFENGDIYLKPEKVFEPDKNMIDYYHEKYSRYLRIHDAIKNIYSPGF